MSWMNMDEKVAGKYAKVNKHALLDLRKHQLNGRTQQPQALMLWQIVFVKDVPNIWIWINTYIWRVSLTNDVTFKFKKAISDPTNEQS